MVRISDVERLESRQLLTAFTPILLADISPGTESTQFDSFASNERHLYFNANGNQLWRTDGSPEGTSYLGDVLTNDSEWNNSWQRTPPPADLGDGRASIFNIRSGITSSIWRTDGTPDGTFEFMANRRYDYPPIQVTDEWSVVMLWHNREFEFWRFGVHDAQPALLGSVRSSGFEPPEVVVRGGHAFIGSPQSQAPRDGSFLYRTDGTPGGTVALTNTLTSDVVVDDESNVHYFALQGERTVWHRLQQGADETEQVMSIAGLSRNLRFHKGQFQYFVSKDVERPRWEIAFSDGTEAGTRLWSTEQPMDPVWFDDLGDASLFGGRSLFKTNGTPEGTKFLTASQYLGQIDGYAYLGYPGNFMSPFASINYVTDGTAVFDAWSGERVGTSDQNPPALPAPPSQSLSFIESSGLVRQSYASGNGGFSRNVSYFAPARNGVLELVQKSEAAARVFAVEDTQYFFDGFEVFSRDSLLVGRTPRSNAIQEKLAVAEGETRDGTYLALGPVDDQVLWRLGKYDALVKIAPVQTLSSHDRSDQYFFFTDNHPTTGHELRVTRGSPANTKAFDMWPGLGSSNPEFVAWPGHTVFLADTPEGGRELWSVISDEQPVAPAQDVTLFRQLIHEDSSTTFASTAANMTGASYTWDLNDDGVFGDAIGPAPTLTTQQLDQLNPRIPRNVDRPYHVLATTPDGQAVQRTSLLRIHNDAPQFTTFDFLPEKLDVEDELSFKLPIHDEDDLEYTVDYGDGTSVVSKSPVFSHQFEAMGRYQIRVSLEDVHRSVTARTFTVTVSDAKNADVFVPGRVFGGKHQTTDLALSNDDYDHSNSIDRIVAAAVDNGIETTHVSGDLSESNRIDATSVPNTHTLAIGHINKGHKRDILSATTNGLFGPNGELTFEFSTAGISDIAIGDLNGDKLADAFVTRATTPDGSVAADFVLLNRGDDTVHPETNSYLDWAGFVGQHASESVELSDVNGDGTLDAVVASNDAVRVWLNNGKGQFTASLSPLAVAANYATAGDLDYDGDMDIIVASDGANSVWLNDGHGVFTDTKQRLGSAKSNHVAFGDLNGDLAPDLLFANGFGDPTTVWWNNGHGQFVDSGVRLAEDLNSTHVILHDMNRDGGLDAIMAFAGAANHIFLATPDRTPPTVTDVRWKTNSDGVQQLSIEFSEATYGSLDLRHYSNNRWWNNRNIKLEWNRTRTVATANLSEYDVSVGPLRLVLDIQDGRRNNATREDEFIALEVDRAMEGDINQDLLIDERDYDALRENYGQAVDEADLNGDGIVNFADFLILSANFDN